MTGIVRLVLLTLTVLVTACMLPAPSSAQQTANLDNFLGMVEPAQVFPERTASVRCRDRHPWRRPTRATGCSATPF